MRGLHPTRADRSVGGNLGPLLRERGARMPRKRPTTPFVEPSASSPTSIVHSAAKTLVSAGCPDAVASWLAPLLARVLPPDGRDESVDAPGNGPIGSIAMVWPNTKLACLDV